MPSVTYVGSGTSFEDKHQPIAGKDEWGVDTLTRVQWGSQPNLASFIGALAQGQTYYYNAQTWYLQTWDPDNDKIFPGVTMTYKGLLNGIPSPKTSGQNVQQTGTISCTSPEEASRTFTYLTRQSVYRYIASGRPSGATYTTPDVSTTPVIIKSVVQNADGTIYLGNVPSGLLTALTPVGTNIEAVLSSCEPIIGTPYFECEDTVTVLLPSN